MGEDKGEWTCVGVLLSWPSHLRLLSLPSPSCTPTAPSHPMPPTAPGLPSGLGCASLTGLSFPSLTDPRMTWTLLGAGARLGLEEGCPDPPCRWGWGTPPPSCCPRIQLGDGHTPLLGKRMCLRPVAFQGCGEASGHGGGGGPGWGRGHLRSSGKCRGLPGPEEARAI